MQDPKLIKTTWTYHTTCPECNADIEMDIVHYEGDPLRTQAWIYECENCGTACLTHKGPEI